MTHFTHSICQSKTRFFGNFTHNTAIYILQNIQYHILPTIDAQLLLDDIAADYGVFIGMIITPTHRFDFNGPDALYHSVVKRRLRQYPCPLCQEHILRDYAKAVEEVSTDCVIQMSFWRVHRRDENGDIDMTLIPADIKAWYVHLSDEEETVPECESDVETS